MTMVTMVMALPLKVIIMVDVIAGKIAPTMTIIGQLPLVIIITTMSTMTIGMLRQPHQVTAVARLCAPEMIQNERTIITSPPLLSNLGRLAALCYHTYCTAFDFFYNHFCTNNLLLLIYYRSFTYSYLSSQTTPPSREATPLLMTNLIIGMETHLAIILFQAWFLIQVSLLCPANDYDKYILMASYQMNYLRLNTAT